MSKAQATLPPKEMQWDFDFATVVKTQQEAVDLMLKLDILLDTLFNNKDSFEKKMDEILPYSFKQTMLKLCNKHHITLTDTTALQEMLLRLKEYLHHMPVVTLKFAFEPKEVFLKTLSDWLFLNMKTHTLIEVNVDPHLIGGVVILLNGVYKDYSIKKKLEDYFEKNTLASI